ncbi:MAG: PH domain-containing protein [Candidatus Heimdallarchaeota archaeon]
MYDEILEGVPFHPLGRFRNKLILWTVTGIVIIGLGIIGLFTLIGFVSQFDSDQSASDFPFIITSEIFWIWYFALSLIVVVVAIILADYYTRTMEFQVLDKEIIVRKGILNKEEKHVPFRTVTNVSSRYGLYDRIFSIGTVQIETAGKSGQQTGPEAKIEGIPNFLEVRDLILIKLREYRGQYATTTELEPVLPSVSAPKHDFHRQMLAEIREIKEILRS